MEPQTLTTGRLKKYSPNYITEVIQNGRIKAAKYRHSFPVPVNIFEDLKSNGIIDLENYFIDRSAFFEFKGNDVIISFINSGACTDLQLRIYHFIIVSAIGFDPINRRTSQSKMNFDKSIQPVQTITLKSDL